MPGQPLRLGPFIGGLNTVSDPTAIADAELAACMNFELDLDGSLISRPPFEQVLSHSSWTERIVLIGTAVFSSGAYILGSNADGVFYYANSQWTLITNTFRATVAIQYANKVWLVPSVGDTGLGGNWDPIAGFTVVAAIPEGGAAEIHKERLYIAPGMEATSNSSRLKFSGPADFTSWGATDFIDISPGDGSKLLDLTTYQDNLLLFKDDSTFVLAYDVRPSDAIVRSISETVGVTQQHCLVNYENQIYVYHRGRVYEIINHDFQRLNVKVPFRLDETAPSIFSSDKVFLSQFGDRLLVGYFNKTYVYGLRTRTWTEWSSTEDNLHYFGPIVALPSTEFEFVSQEHYAGSRLQSNTAVVRMRDGYDAFTREKSTDQDEEVTDTFDRTVVDNWDSADTGQLWTVLGAANADFDVTSGFGTITLTTIGQEYTAELQSISLEDVDITAVLSVDRLATGAWITASLLGRYLDANNFYSARVEWKETGNVGLGLYKNVAGVSTTLAGYELGTYTIGEQFVARLQIQSSTVRAKFWRLADPEPQDWNMSVLDVALPLPGSVAARGARIIGNTNTTPTVSFDSILVANPNSYAMIECSAVTKNFDMAVPHQFKRLWWWGADLASSNTITGRAAPIILSFEVAWQDLTDTAWEDLGTWAAPLSEAADVVTTVTPSTGNLRRFAKFLRGLRYRQISFQVGLETEGTTVDGPARIFSLMVITESKQVVPKQVN